MNAAERRVRLIVLAERIQQLEGELVALTEDMLGKQLDRHLSAGWHLSRAAETILDGPTPRGNLETALRLSITDERDKRGLSVVDFPGGE